MKKILMILLLIILICNSAFSQSFLGFEYYEQEISFLAGAFLTVQAIGLSVISFYAWDVNRGTNPESTNKNNTVRMVIDVTLLVGAAVSLFIAFNKKIKGKNWNPIKQ